MDKQKKKLMWAIYIVALIEMPGFALTPGINQMKTTAFPEMSLALIQTGLALASLAQPVTAFCTALLVNRRIATKKMVILFGLCLLAADAVLALYLNSQFWHFILLNIVMGVMIGCVHPNMFGLMFDNFEPHERQAIAGYQSAIINGAGIAMGVIGGLLATLMWYGGYLVFFAGLPVAVIVFFTVPNYWAPVADRSVKKTSARINPKIFYYCAVTLIFMMVYTACASNLSTHIQGIGNSATAGIGTAFLMGGGVVAGLLFNKLSKKFDDYAISISLCIVFIGYIVLSLSQHSLPLVFASVFLVGTSLSFVMPHCIFKVSTLATDKSNSQMAAALITTVTPATGSFLSPVIFTNITTALFGESTVARYQFIGAVVIVFAAVVAVVTFVSGRKQVA